MNRKMATKTPSPGDRALISVGFKLPGFDNHDRTYYICRVRPYQKVEIASFSAESIHAISGEPQTHIMVKMVDTTGVHRFIRMNMNILIFAANCDQPVR